MNIYLEKDIFKINDFIPSLIKGSSNFFFISYLPLQLSKHYHR